MTIEKAFAIKASPHDIYAALERDIATASRGGGRFEVLRRERDREIQMRVTIGDIPCWLTYRLDPGAGYTEVVALLTPFGFKYAFFRIITLGMRNQGFELALVQGLANLKQAVEGPGAAGAGDDGATSRDVPDA